MEEAQIKQIIERQPLHGSALLDPRCKILLLVCIGFVSYFLSGEVVSLALMLVYGLFIALGNGGKWAAKMIVTYIVVAYLNALLRYVQVPVLSVIMSVFGVTVLKLIPIMMMGLWILRTTYMDDLMVALQRMRLPRQSQSHLLLCSDISLLYGLNTDKSEARWIFAVSAIPCGNGYPIR